jgi:hypothetical protein
MCRSLAGRTGSRERDECGCSCSCPATMTIEEELQLLEGHRKYMQEQTVITDRKIAALKTAKES